VERRGRELGEQTHQHERDRKLAQGARVYDTEVGVRGRSGYAVRERKPV